MKRKKSNIKELNFILAFISVFLIIGYFLIPYTESKYLSEATNKAEVKIATWNFKINNNSDKELEINLASTVVENNYTSDSVIPGSEGIINLNVDYSNTKVAFDYVIELKSENTNLPSNLKLYTDENYTNEFVSFSNSVPLENDGTTKYKIYWKWEYTEIDETTEWSGKDIKLYLTAKATQKVDDSV